MAAHDDAWFSARVNGAVRGYHVYGDIWNPYVGEQLTTERESDNTEDKYAVAVRKDGTDTVGHVPREISKLCSFFIQRSGIITCEVTGDRRRSPLFEGGLEIPCIYTFKGKKKIIDKLKVFLTECNYRPL